MILHAFIYLINKHIVLFVGGEKAKFFAVCRKRLPLNPLKQSHAGNGTIDALIINEKVLRSNPNDMKGAK